MNREVPVGPIRDKRGYYGIGIEGSKYPCNVGTLWRTAMNFGADFLFTVGARYHRDATDTPDATGHMPLLSWPDIGHFKDNISQRAVVIGIEIRENSENLVGFRHPECAVYLLGSENKGLGEEALSICERVIEVPTYHCMNVAVAGAVVMYDRYYKRVSGFGNSRYELIEEQSKLREELSQANCALAAAEERLLRIEDRVKSYKVWDEFVDLFEGEVDV